MNNVITAKRINKDLFLIEQAESYYNSLGRRYYSPQLVVGIEGETKRLQRHSPTQCAFHVGYHWGKKPKHIAIGDRQTALVTYTDDDITVIETSSVGLYLASQAFNIYKKSLQENRLPNPWLHECTFDLEREDYFGEPIAPDDTLDIVLMKREMPEDILQVIMSENIGFNVPQVEQQEITDRQIIGIPRGVVVPKIMPDYENIMVRQMVMQSQHSGDILGYYHKETRKIEDGEGVLFPLQFVGRVCNGLRFLGCAPYRFAGHISLDTFTQDVRAVSDIHVVTARADIKPYIPLEMVQNLLQNPGTINAQEDPGRSLFNHYLRKAVEDHAYGLNLMDNKKVKAIMLGNIGMGLDVVMTPQGIAGFTSEASLILPATYFT